jgi:outer membrane protein TolC
MDHATEVCRRSLDLESIRQYADRLAQSEPGHVPFDSSDGLSLHEAEAVALHFNPRLRLSRARAEVPLASAEEAGWWPDPQLEAEVLKFLNRGRRTRFRFDGPSFDGVNTGIFSADGISASGLETTAPGYRRVDGDFIEDPWIVGASLSFTIPISGRLAVEKDLKWTEYSAAWRRILVSEWRLLTKLREMWFEWSTLRERVGVVRENMASLKSVVEMATRLASGGEMSPTEARVLNIALARRGSKLQNLERETEQKRLAIFAMLGVAPDAPVTLQQEIQMSFIDLARVIDRKSLIANHPRLKAARADYETAEQQLRLEIRMQYPDLQLGPSFSFEEGFSRLGLGVGFPLPLWNRNRQGVAQALAERDTARVSAEAEVEIVMAEVAQFQTQLGYASQQRDYLIAEVTPLVDRQLAEVRKLLDLGEVDVLLLRDALNSDLETRLEVLDLTLAEARAANQLAQTLQPRWFTPKQTETEEDDE